MAPLFLIIALVVQGTFIYADVEVDNKLDERLESVERDVLVKPDVDDEAAKDFRPSNKDFIDMLFLTSDSIFPTFPTSSATMMSQATNNNQTSEEQLEAMKKVAEDIAKALQSDLASLMSCAISLNTTNKTEDNVRSKRSAETPMDSTKLVMRLLKHIKSNNEYQNIAIEKMMSAQEIADKFGIEFNPDPEILSDLAVAANDHAQELTSMLKDACDMKNATQEIEFVSLDDQPTVNDTFYVYSLHPEEETIHETVPSFEFLPEILPKSQKPVNHVHKEPHSHHVHHESQIPPPPVHHHSPSVSSRPNFYDPFPYTSDIYSPYVDAPIFLIPIEQPEPEPEMVGEEVEEAIVTRLFVERGEEPGSSTVNQVTTYSVTEKTHFRTPQIEKLPQQFQYSFFLI